MEGHSLGVFYAYDGLLGYQDLEWLQGALNALIGLFRRIGLADNFSRSNTMTFHPVAIRSGMS